MNFSDPTNLLIAGVYFVIVAILSFFSIFGVYVLVRYGKSTLFSLIISLSYGFFFLIILSASYKTLQGLMQ